MVAEPDMRDSCRLPIVDAELITDPVELQRLERKLRSPRELYYRSLARHYRLHHHRRLKRELNWFAKQPSLDKAIDDAAMSRNWKGKRFVHQRRIRAGVLRAARELLLAAEPRIRKCDNFEELSQVIESALESLRGAGEVYTYEVSLRIGAKLGFSPQEAYLHTGTRQGAIIVGLNTQPMWRGMKSLPPWLQELEPHEVADFLYTYKTKLAAFERRTSIVK
jgi:hypothetical protein